MKDAASATTVLHLLMGHLKFICPPRLSRKHQGKYQSSEGSKQCFSIMKNLTFSIITKVVLCKRVLGIMKRCPLSFKNAYFLAGWWWHMPVIAALWTQKQVDICEFEVSLVTVCYTEKLS